MQHNPSRRTVVIALLGVVIGLYVSACSKQNPTTSSAAITGTLRYREPVTLTAASKVQLQLTDVSVDSGPAAEIALVTLTDVRTLPFEYTVNYDAARIDATHRYTVSARVYEGERLRFATDSAHAALTQGASQHVDIDVALAGANEAALSAAPVDSKASDEVFEGQLRTAEQVTMYRAGFNEDHIAWLEEDRPGATKQAFHARYEFKGALLLRYADNEGFEFICNDAGKPTNVTRKAQVVAIKDQMPAINAARNRAALLRSHAIATREIKAHRVATRQDETG